MNMMLALSVGVVVIIVAVVGYIRLCEARKSGNYFAVIALADLHNSFFRRR